MWQFRRHLWSCTQVGVRTNESQIWEISYFIKGRNIRLALKSTNSTTKYSQRAGWSQGTKGCLCIATDNNKVNELKIMISLNVFAYLIKFNIIILCIILLLLWPLCVLCILFNKWLPLSFGLSPSAHPVLRPWPPRISHHNFWRLLVDLYIQLII